MSEKEKSYTKNEILKILIDTYQSDSVEFRSKLFLESLEDSNVFNNLEEVLL